MMDDLREQMRQERLAHWADGAVRMAPDLRGAMLSALSCLASTTDTGRSAPWIPGACFSISPELLPFLRNALETALREDAEHGR
jgi:hypothetical protein